jgi:Transposase DDE domain
LFTCSGVHLRQETKAVMDSGFQGVQKEHANTALPTKNPKLHPLTKEPKQVNRALSRQRILVENVIGSLKRFRILAERYRNRRNRFGLRFNLVAAIYNMELGDAS